MLGVRLLGTGFAYVCGGMEKDIQYRRNVLHDLIHEAHLVSCDRQACDDVCGDAGAVRADRSVVGIRGDPSRRRALLSPPLSEASSVYRDHVGARDVLPIARGRMSKMSTRPVEDAEKETMRIFETIWLSKRRALAPAVRRLR
jgi:hypothetical protein